MWYVIVIDTGEIEGDGYQWGKDAIWYVWGGGKLHNREAYTIEWRPLT